MSCVAENQSRSQAFRERSPVTGWGLWTIKPLLALIAILVGVLILAGLVGCQRPKSLGQTVDQQSAPGSPDSDFLSGAAAGGGANPPVSQHLGIGEASAGEYLNDSEERWAGQLGSLAEVVYTQSERDGRAFKAASLDGASTMGAGLGHPVNGGDTAQRDSATPTDNFPPSRNLISVLRSEDMPASTIMVNSINRSPELTPIGDRRLAEGTRLHVRVSAVEPDGHSVTLVVTGLPYFATFTDGLNGSGRLTLAPGFDDAGIFADITITASDGDLSDSETLTITVGDVNRPPELAPTGNRTLEEGTALRVAVSAIDPDGHPIVLTASGLPYFASLTDDGDGKGTLSLSPGFDDAGTFTDITITASDGDLSDSETLTVTVSNVREPRRGHGGGHTPTNGGSGPSNHAPVADDRAVSVDEDTAVVITLSGSDQDGDSLEFIILTLPTNGVLTVGPDPLTSTPFSLSMDTVTYAPSADFNGSDSFTFKVNDGVADSNTATVSITVEPINDAPVADDQAVSVDEDTSVAMTLTGSDIDGDPLKFIVVLTLPANGGLTDGIIAVTATPFVLSGDTLSYTPDADFNGQDGFTFKVNDGIADSEIAAVSITVIDEPPVANDQAVSVDEDTAAAITLTGTDVDGDPLEFIVLTLPANGVLTIGPNTLTSAPFSLNLNTVTYTPNTNFNGQDSFTFRVNDGMANSNAATVSINVNPVNDPPVADAQAVNTNQDTAVGITLTGSDIDGDPIAEFIVLTLPANGVLTAGLGEVVSTPFSLNLDTVTYTPNAGFSGQDAFTFKVNDGALDSNPATVSIIVNDAPVADDQAVSTDKDKTVAITLTGSDVNGDSLEFIVLTLPTNGVLTVGPGTLTATPFSLNLDTLTYSPNADFNGSDSFTFRVNDGMADSSAATVSITVNPVNDAPVADDQGVVTREDTSVAVTLSGSDVDSAGSPEFIVVTLPSNGVLTIGSTPATSTPFSLNLDTITYAPNAGFKGLDAFTFGLNDGMLDSNVATVSIVVTDDCLCAESKGFWKDQFSGLGQPQIDGPTLGVFLSIVRFGSDIFDEEIALSGIADVRLVLGGQRTTDAMPEGGSGSKSRSTDATTTTTTLNREQRRRRALAQTLAAWLNFAKGGIEGGELIDINGDGIADTAFDGLISEVESILSNPNATNSDLVRAKDLAQAVNEHDKNNSECVA